MLEGFVQPDSGHDIPAVVRLPVGLQILADEQALVVHRADLADRENVRGRRNDRTIERHGVGAVAVARRLAGKSVKQIHSADQRQVVAELVDEMGIEIEIVDEPVLILGVGRAAQIGMEKRADVDDVRMREGQKRIPGAEAGLLRPFQRTVILVLVNRRVGRIEIGVDRRRLRRAGSQAKHGTGRNVAHDGGFGIYMQRSRPDIERRSVQKLSVGRLFAMIRESHALPIERQRLREVRQRR